MPCNNCENTTEIIPKPPILYRIMMAAMSPLLKVTGMTCEATTKLSLQKLDSNLSIKERMQLKIHLSVCSVCRSVPKQLEMIEKSSNKIHLDEENKIDSENLIKSLSRLKEKLENEMKEKN